MQANTTIVSEEWNSYFAERDGVLTFVSFDEELLSSELPNELQYCLRVILRVRNPNDVGAPVPPENEVLWQLEDDLVERMNRAGVVGRLVARLTRRGLRELVFQLAAVETGRSVSEQWIKDSEEYEVELSEHSGWDFFNDEVRPSTADLQLIKDNELISQLIADGADPDKEHEIRFRFRGDADGLSRITDHLSERRYSPVNEERAEDCVILSIPLTLDLQRITAESLQNHALATQNGVDCIGWEAKPCL